MKASDYARRRDLLAPSFAPRVNDCTKPYNMTLREPRPWSPISAVVVLALFLGAAALRTAPAYFDYPAARAINNIAMGQNFANRFAAGVAYPAIEGVVLISLVWYCWFSGIDADLRARLVRGVFAAVVAGLAADLWQHEFPSTPKPIFDTTLHIQVPAVLGDIDVLRATSFPGSPSFPSERGTMFAGLAIAVFIVRRGVGLAALVSTLGIEGSRIFLGLHYPTDLIGGFCLAGAIILLSEADRGLGFADRLVRWEKASTSTFYMCAFLGAYQIANAFEDLRSLLPHLLL